MNLDTISQLIFFTTVAFAFVSWGVLANRSIWPKLRRKPRVDALRPLGSNYLAGQNRSS